METITIIINGVKQITIIGGLSIFSQTQCFTVMDPPDNEYGECIEHVWTKEDTPRFVGWLLPVECDSIYEFKQNPKFDG